MRGYKSTLSWPLSRVLSRCFSTTQQLPHGRPRGSERFVFVFQERTSFNFPPRFVCPPPYPPDSPRQPASHLGQCSMKRCAHFKNGAGEGHRLPAVIKLLENSVPSARGSRLAALSFRCRASGWTLRTQEDPKMGCLALVFPFASDSTDECR